jgi:hypothetical protein
MNRESLGIAVSNSRYRKSSGNSESEKMEAAERKERVKRLEYYAKRGIPLFSREGEPNGDSK